jgi:MoaA/NifB/PqqE/SkfB family radical SAM enzyme
MNVKLKEIIWEITPQCNKNCDYCGSKNILNDKPLNSTRLKNIATNIAKYHVEEITLSGGEPATINSELLFNILDILRRVDKKTKVKIVTNGLLYKHRNKLINSFDVIGLSINTEREISELKLPKDPFIKDKTTIITNLGKHNIFEFNEILNFIISNDFKCWQVQLNQGKDQLNLEGIKYLYDKLETLGCDNTTSELSIILADNLQKQHNCTAGIMSCGISYKGEVVGCISERAWNNGEFVKVYGTIGDKSSGFLQEIWENEFKDIRFGERRKSCRDCIEYPNKQKDTKQYPPINIFYAVQSKPLKPEKLPQFPTNPQVFLYGVQQPPQVVVYGAFDRTTMLYGVGKEVTKDSTITWTDCVDTDGDNL